MVGQATEGIEREAAELSAARGGPLLKGLAVGQVEVGEEIAAVEGGSARQRGGISAAGQQLEKRHQVKLVGSIRMDSQGVALAQQKGHGSALAAVHGGDELAQLVDDLAQVDLSRSTG
jgi:hypothetical protein